MSPSAVVAQNICQPKRRPRPLVKALAWDHLAAAEDAYVRPITPESPVNQPVSTPMAQETPSTLKRKFSEVGEGTHNFRLIETAKNQRSDRELQASQWRCQRQHNWNLSQQQADVRMKMHCHGQAAQTKTKAQWLQTHEDRRVDQAKTQAQADAEAKTQAQADAEAKAVAEVEAEVEAEAKAEALVAAEAKVEAEANAAAEAKAAVIRAEAKAAESSAAVIKAANARLLSFLMGNAPKSAGQNILRKNQPECSNSFIHYGDAMLMECDDGQPDVVKPLATHSRERIQKTNKCVVDCFGMTALPQLHHKAGRTPSHLESLRIAKSHHLESLRIAQSHAKLHIVASPPGQKSGALMFIDETKAQQNYWSSPSNHGRQHPITESALQGVDQRNTVTRLNDRDWMLSTCK